MLTLLWCRFLKAKALSKSSLYPGLDNNPGWTAVCRALYWYIWQWHKLVHVLPWIKNIAITKGCYAMHCICIKYTKSAVLKKSMKTKIMAKCIQMLWIQGTVPVCVCVCQLWRGGGGDSSPEVSVSVWGVHQIIKPDGSKYTHIHTLSFSPS